MKKLGLILSTLLFAIATFVFTASPVLAETYEVKMGSDTGQLKYVPETLTLFILAISDQYLSSVFRGHFFP